MNTNATPISAIARQIQIDLITDAPNGIVNFFNKIWEQLSIIEIDVYHSKGGEFVYYTTGSTPNVKQWIFYQDDKNQYLWCNYSWYWSNLEHKFNLEYDDIQALTHILLENAIQKNVSRPIRHIGDGHIKRALSFIPVPNMAVDINDTFLQETINKKNIFQKMLLAIKKAVTITPTTSQNDSLDFILNNTKFDDRPKEY